MLPTNSAIEQHMLTMTPLPLMQAGIVQGMVSRALVIPLLNRIKVLHHSWQHSLCRCAKAREVCPPQLHTPFCQETDAIQLLHRAGLHLQEFSEWAQCQVLEVASHYQPSNEQEVFDVMNVLDDRLSHSNSAVVMATVKLFLHLTLRMPATHQQVRN